MECKSEQTLRNQQARVPELIDTLWNVNVAVGKGK